MNTSDIVTTTADAIIVDVPSPTVTFDKKILVGALAGLTVGAGATLLALKLKEIKARKDAEKTAEADVDAVNPIRK